MSCCDHDCSEPQIDERYRRVLWAALAVNLAMFLVEIVAGIIAGSVSLRADALDFLADAANYAVCPRRGRSGTALARAGVDAASANRLSFADEAAAPLVAIPDTAELQREDANGAPLANADDREPRIRGEDDFERKILAMARRFAGGQMPDFATASFAELFAWSLIQPAAE